MDLVVAVHHVKLLVAAVTVVTQKMVRDANVAGVLRRYMLVCQVNTWLVVLVDFDWPLDKLARDGFKYVEQSQ